MYPHSMCTISTLSWLWQLVNESSAVSRKIRMEAKLNRKSGVTSYVLFQTVVSPTVCCVDRSLDHCVMKRWCKIRSILWLWSGWKGETVAIHSDTENQVKNESLTATHICAAVHSCIQACLHLHLCVVCFRTPFNEEGSKDSLSVFLLQKTFFLWFSRVSLSLLHPLIQFFLYVFFSASYWTREKVSYPVPQADDPDWLHAWK